MISVAESRDAALLAALQASAFDDRWSADFIACLLDQPGVVAAVAAESPSAQGAQGMILVRSIAGEAEILTLAVRPAARRRGVARALVRYGAARADALGAGVMFLEVSAANAAAIPLYLGLGFVRAGLRPGYYATPDGVRQDALILRVALPLSVG